MATSEAINLIRLESFFSITADVRSFSFWSTIVSADVLKLWYALFYQFAFYQLA